MSRKIQWGIIGLGKIAHKFALDLLLSDDAELYGVASRDKEKAEKFYDQNGNKIEENHYSWFDTFWEPYLSLEIAYDSLGNSVSSSNNWAWNGSSWGFGDGYESTFDLSVDSNNVIDPYWIGGSKIRTNEGSSWVNNAWQLNFSSTYFYSGGFPSSVNDQFGKDQGHFVKVFPNPASDVLMLQMQDELFNHITVFDLQGHRRISSRIQLNKSIPLNDLPNGIYIYQLSSSSGKVNYGKFEVIK